MREVLAMAVLQGIGGDSDSVFWPLVGTDVYVKEQWSDAWTWIPWLVCEEATESQNGRARLRYDFGRIKRAEFDDWHLFYPWFLNGCYVAVVVYDYWGEALLFTGVIDSMTVQPHGHSQWSQGQQWFYANEITDLFGRRRITGSHTVDGFVDAEFDFNEVGFRGIFAQGNMGEGRVFSGPGGALWSSYDALWYVMNYYAGIFPDLAFEVVGEYELLRQNKHVHKLAGLTVGEAIDRLVDRRRGLGWRLLTNGSGTIYLWIYSLLPVPMAVGSVYVPANPFQREFSFAGERIVEPEIQINNLALYDHLQILGGELYTCCSLSYFDGSLVPGWTESQEASYSSTDDVHRASEVLSAVYQLHRVPDDWSFEVGGYPVVPYMDDLCGIYTDVAGSIVQNPRARVFENRLPFPPSGEDDSEDYQLPIGWVLAADPEHPEENPQWVATHRLRSRSELFSDVNFTVGDRAMAVRTQGAINHVLGKGHFEGYPLDSDIEPAADYLSLVATVMFKTDTRLRVEVTRNGWPITSVGRTKRIEYPEAQVHYVVPGTAIDTDGESLQLHQGGFVRDDRERLYVVAAMAMAWYGIPRATLRYRTKSIHVGNPVGTMVMGVYGPEGYTIIGTPVTSRTWTFGEGGNSTVVETGFNELDYRSTAV